MKTLNEYIKESILDDEDVLIGNAKDFINWKIIYDKTKPVIDDILNSPLEFDMGWFLEENNLRLDKDVVKKIVNKLKKALPKEALFGRIYGVPQIAKQRVEDYRSVNYANPKYAYYKISISYAFYDTLRDTRRITQSSENEYIIYLTKDFIYALDISETKNILDELDTHFAKYVTKDDIKRDDKYTIESNIGGKYRVYSFKDLIKEFKNNK
jgi:hypothetical protein